ncbi:ABC-three component system middle component 1 [Paenibacillus sp. CR_12]|uniref:ABC-three component system middle component 1 n=1 Tax=Paenibacillus sp. CR_12 TaxID=3055793 RepID=UPI0035C21EBC
MKEIIEQLNFPYLESRVSEFHYSVLNIRDDKLVFFVEILDIPKLHHFISLLPEAKEILLTIVRNQRPNAFTNVTLPAFLWDLYVVALHDINNSERFDETDITMLERDKFVARKIIVEYTSQEEAVIKINQQLCPEKELDILLAEYQENQTWQESLISQVYESIEPDQEFKVQRNVEQIIGYLNKIDSVRNAIE